MFYVLHFLLSLINNFKKLAYTTAQTLFSCVLTRTTTTILRVIFYNEFVRCFKGMGAIRSNTNLINNLKHMLIMIIF